MSLLQVSILRVVVKRRLHTKVLTLEVIHLIHYPLGQPIRILQLLMIFKSFHVESKTSMTARENQLGLLLRIPISRSAPAHLLPRLQVLLVDGTVRLLHVGYSSLPVLNLLGLPHPVLEFFVVDVHNFLFVWVGLLLCSFCL